MCMLSVMGRALSFRSGLFSNVLNKRVLFYAFNLLFVCIHFSVCMHSNRSLYAKK